ncbi:MAG: hypothetical protein ACRD3Q_17370 [Terriglobales bacterium]
MSAKLKDFRGKITFETDVALEAEARMTGRDRSDIAREILHSWAAKKLHAATVLTDLALSKGIEGSGGAARGKRT